MKMSVKGILLSLSILAMPHHADAQTVFMVQLGAFESEPEARSHWDTLSSELPELFEDLNYVSSERVMQPDNFISYRTQAGPIATRDEAEEVCDDVISAGYGCYVAETAMFVSEEAVSQMSGMAPAAPEPQAFEPQPLLPEGGVKIQPDQSQSTMGNVEQVPVADVAVPTTLPSANSTTQTLKLPQGTGTIAVEEAIPVPLSAQPQQNNPYLERGNMLMDASPSDSSRVRSFWADIGYFSTDTAAAQYVRVLKSRDSLLPAKLRIRLVRPYGQVSGAERLTLRMGPFMTTRPIRRLCALTRPERLRCRAIKDLGGSVKKESRYAVRHKEKRRLKESRYSSDRRSGQQQFEQQYYVQLGSFLSPRAAEDKWRELRSRHGKVLAEQTKDIAAPRRASSTSSRLFRLRSGPYKSMTRANDVCGRLKAAGTLCVVAK